MLPVSLGSREQFTRWPIESLATALLVGLALVGCSSGPDDDSPVTVPTSSVDRPWPSDSVDDAGSGAATDGDGGVQPVGFGTIEARITSADGEECEVCLWLADGADARSQGLRGVTDLGGADGMVFVWEGPAESNFVMIGTPTPLSIAWFAEDGTFVSAVDMEPCLDGDSADCARYSAEGPYTAAIEVFQGDLDDLGIGPGARLELLEGTEGLGCPES